MGGFFLFLAFLFVIGFFAGSTGKDYLSFICLIILIVVFAGSWIHYGGVDGLINGIFAIIISAIPIAFGYSLGEKFDNSPSSSSKASSIVNSDIPNHSNWNRIYDNLREKSNIIGSITTKEEAIEQFNKDYERTIKAFAELKGLQDVDDIEKTYLFEFFKDMKRWIETDQVEFEEHKGGEFYLYHYPDHPGLICKYHHEPYLKYDKYDLIMWRGIIEREGSFVRYGLSNEWNQQYWHTFDSSVRSHTIIDALRGEI